MEEQGYTSKYTLLMGNHVFNATVYNRSSCFEKMWKPTVEELNSSDTHIGSKYMVMSITAQICSLKLVLTREYLIFINVTLYKEVIAKFISPSVSQFVLELCACQSRNCSF